MSFDFFDFNSSFKKAPLSIPNLSKSEENLDELYQKKIEIYEQKQLQNQKDLDFHSVFSKKEDKEKREEERKSLQKQEETSSISLNGKVIRLLKEQKKKKAVVFKTKKKTYKETIQEEKNKLQKLYEDFERDQRQALFLKKEKIDISAEITTNQSIISGKEIEFRLLEELQIGNSRIPKGTILYGLSHFDSHRIKVEFSNIQLEGKLIPFKPKLFDLDGFEGIALSNNVVLKEMETHLSEEALNLDESMDPSLSNIAQKGLQVTGKLIKKIASKKKKQLEVELDASHKVILRNMELVNP